MHKNALGGSLHTAITGQSNNVFHAWDLTTALFSADLQEVIRLKLFINSILMIYV